MAETVIAPMVGKILAIDCKVGDKVAEDDVLLTMEAMKMEIPVVAPAGGTVKEIKVAVGESVDADAPLLVIGEGTNELQRIIIARQLVQRNPA